MSDQDHDSHKHEGHGKQGHRPNILIFYNRVNIELYTNAIKNLFVNDFIIAAKIDEIKV